MDFKVFGNNNVVHCDFSASKTDGEATRVHMDN